MQIKDADDNVLFDTATLAGAPAVTELKLALELAAKAGVPLPGAQLYSAKLRGAKLHRLNLAGADLRVADLMGADLSGANLAGANLQMAFLMSANLAGANLADANLRYVVFKDANLASAHLEHADLTHSDCETDIKCQGLETTYIQVRKSRARAATPPHATSPPAARRH